MYFLFIKECGNRYYLRDIQLEETIRQINAFQHVRSTKGAEACPAGWKPGKKTLKPGPDLVGNVWKEWDPYKDH